ncbi:hypothetical protein P4345_25790 [Cytobacillus horneckiae]|uniref:hypothetical protein n=1 Tax=Cytobacillus horneckiae TaxID=549687 RepID=UPI002E1CF40E|nr:hypothetical protein [Cytobacillus horneckiae]
MGKDVQHRDYLYTALFFIILGAVWYKFISSDSTTLILFGAAVLDSIVRYFHYLKRKTHDSEYPEYRTYFLLAVILFLIGLGYSIFDDDGYKVISLLFFSAIGVVYFLIGLNSRSKYRLNKNDQ